MIISSRHYLPIRPLYMPDGPVCELAFFETLITFLLALVINAINLLYSHNCCKREKSTRWSRMLRVIKTLIIFLRENTRSRKIGADRLCLSENHEVEGGMIIE